jgi:osmotically-inducible protein OsmY
MYPTLLQANDQELKSRILTCVRPLADAQIGDLKVEVAGGVAKVTGHLVSHHDRDLWLQYCQHVPGVVRIIDELHVDRSHHAPS